MSISAILIVLVIALMLAVPAFMAVRRHDASTDDYLTAKRSIHWFPAGISAGVSMLSGFSFTALVGYSYTFGMFAIWFVIVRNIGEILISRKVWPALYDASLKYDAVTLGQLASKIFDRDLVTVRILSGTIVTFLLTLYVSSQLQSAGIALDRTIGVPVSTGIAGAGFILLAYCFWGGVRSSIWTDNSQAVLMIITLISIPLGILYTAGGFTELSNLIAGHADATYLNPFSHPDIPYEGVYVFSLLFIGFCILGQPHVFSRFITVNNKKNMRKAQNTYYVTGVTMNLLAVAVGIMARAILPPETFTDADGVINAESALFAAATVVFPAWFAWFIAAGAASAAMSTGDSQIQAASTSLVLDICRPVCRFFSGDAVEHPQHWTQHHWATKSATAFIILVSTIGALSLTQHTVFDIVEVAWSTQGSMFFAIFVLFASANRSFNPDGRVLSSIMIIGAGATLSWKFLGLNHIAYPAMIGMTLSCLLLICYYRISAQRR